MGDVPGPLAWLPRPECGPFSRATGKVRDSRALWGVDRVPVTVVGGGVIGLGVAYELAAADVEVVLFERERVGGATSLGNAGWITPALSATPSLDVPAGQSIPPSSPLRSRVPIVALAVPQRLLAACLRIG